MKKLVLFLSALALLATLSINAQDKKAVEHKKTKKEMSHKKDAPKHEAKKDTTKKK